VFVWERERCTILYRVWCVALLVYIDWTDVVIWDECPEYFEEDMEDADELEFMNELPL
jgi:hypothetical protein